MLTVDRREKRMARNLQRYSLLVVAVLVCCSTALAQAAITLRPVDIFSTGVFGKSAAEIPAYCQKTQRVFVVNAALGQVDVFLLNGDGQLTRVGVINAAADVGAEMAGVNSVSVSSGTLAVAVEAELPFQVPHAQQAGPALFFFRF